MGRKCTVRKDLQEQDLAVPVGEGKYAGSQPVPYRWLSDDEGFQIFLDGKWQEAYSIDFEFPYSSK